MNAGVIAGSGVWPFKLHTLIAAFICLDVRAFKYRSDNSSHVEKF